MPAFARKYDRESAAAELGIDPSVSTLLLMAGGAGISGMARRVKRLLALGTGFQLIALAGRNARMLADLQKLAATHRGRLFPMGFTNQIEKVMAISDLAITKSGGLTTSECLAMGIPMVIVSPIPGQEERNADFLLEHGAALKAYDEAGLEFRVQSLLQNPDKLAELRRNAAALGKPAAADSVLQLVLDDMA
jgi:processive 1,2-diacylglycerol beta-glucosyltransferase